MSPTDEEKDDLLLSCRYGELEDVQAFVQKYGEEPLSSIRDENSNTILHMICGNGHDDILDFILSKIPSTLLSAQNNNGSTALHWAALNSHLSTMQKLVQFPGGPGVDLIDIKNAAGRSPLGEAEMAGWEEGANWLVQVMNLDDGKDEEKDAKVEDGPVSARDIEVEIQDADGQVAKMTISGDR
ncbi:cytoplasmic protein [Moniliophthora roreri MCA 2997]|uniref:Cytoplasmic protein n=2 Tax=Moniliophthora roreri TaxID=221103 RepID=V2X934_MONRO|nr:cytoplasmic protein [Moniliophthora roreri MCA 2997]KAI3621182.1 cytoplasmic protein [Moniliophthora roreri]